jgi:hypothetical protein
VCDIIGPTHGSALATSETFACHNFRVMIHMGIRCSECGRVHFLSALGRLRRLSRLTQTRTKGVYQVTCISPCGAITYFRIEDTRPFAVADDLYRRGYAELENTNQVKLHDSAAPLTSRNFLSWQPLPSGSTPGGKYLKCYIGCQDGAKHSVRHQRAFTKSQCA